jgi:hypothetical protein
MVQRANRLFAVATAVSLALAALFLIIVVLSTFGRVDLELQRWPLGRVDGTPSDTFAFVIMRTAALLDHQEFAAAGHEAEVEPGAMIHIPLTRCWMRFAISVSSPTSVEGWTWDYVDHLAFTNSRGVVQVVTRAIFPFWPFVFVALILPGLAETLRRRRMKRERQGCCVVCGYNLQATPLRCPECGTVPRTASSEVTR